MDCSLQKNVNFASHTNILNLNIIYIKRSCSTNVNMVVKIFTVTKDEDHLIEDFIIYHGYLFGIDNIIIIDNNSTNSKVSIVYEKYKPYGLTVYNEPDYTNNGQGNAFTKIMTLYKDQCDFLIGLDTDEFIFYLPDVSNKCIKENITEYLENIPRHFNGFLFKKCYESVVDKSSKYYIDYEIQDPAKHMHSFNTGSSACNATCRKL